MPKDVAASIHQRLLNLARAAQRPFDELLQYYAMEQVDVGFGDVVHPAASEQRYPTLLDHPAPVLRIYPPETVIAEKVEAILHLGSLNSRMKDFDDVWRLSQQGSFDGSMLCEALRKTLENRSTDAIPFADLASELIESDDKQARQPS